MNSEQLPLPVCTAGGGFEVVCADCLEHMRTMPDDGVDAIITDPPYGLSFMGKEWDSFGSDTRQPGDDHYSVSDNAYGRSKVRYGHGSRFADSMMAFQAAMTPIFEEALRVAKPGAHLLCFGGTRTFHRMACAIEDAGWEIRDCIMWVYGSGFPKSMDVAKAIRRSGHDPGEWEGWGTCLKPAWEPIIVARKPLDGTVAHNVLTWGVGALNIDACRVPIGNGDDVFAKNPHTRSKGKNSGIYGEYGAAESDWSGEKGRFPANLVHDGSQMVLDLFPDTGKSSGGGRHTRGNPGEESTGVYGSFTGGTSTDHIGMGDSGSAARFFNAFRVGEASAQRSYADRGATDWDGRPGMRREPTSADRFFYCAKASKKERGEGNSHPTVKPVALMKWLVRLVTPEGGVVLDPFAGSGTTLVACKMLGRKCVGIEREPEYVEIINQRLRSA